MTMPLALYLAFVVSPGPSFALVWGIAVGGVWHLAVGATVCAVLTMIGLAQAAVRSS